MDNLLSTKEAAQILNVKPATLERWRNRKLFGVPFFTADVKRGNTWYYDRERVEQLKAVYQPGILQDMYKLAFLNPEAEDTPDGDFQKTTTSRETPAPYFQKTTTSLQARQFGVPRHRGYYSTAQVAEMFSVTARTVQQWVERGVLRWDRYDHANKWLFAQTTIKNFAARRLHNSNYGLPTLFKEMNDMTNEAVNALEVDAKAAADEVFGNGESAIPVDADNTHAAQVAPHAPNDSDDAEPVTLKQFFAWCTLVSKIRDGQLDAVNRLRRELKDTGIITDRQQLIDLAGGKDCYHNFRVFLLQFNLDFVDDKTGELQQLVAHEDGTCGFENVIDAEEISAVVTLEQRAEKIRRLQANVQRGIIEIGNELIAAKAEIGHGNWAAWLEKEFEWTQRTANNFMRVAERFGKLENVFQFKPSTLQAMLALPAGSEDEFIDAQANAGKPVNEMSAREVQSAVKEFNQRKAVTNDDSTESPTPTTPAREVDSSAAEIQATNVQDDSPVDSMDNDGGNGEVVGGEVKRICRGKVAAFDVIGDDDDQCDDTPAQIVNARDDVQDSSGDATRNEINALIDRVVELILDADDDALDVTKAGLAGIVAALEKKNRPPLTPTGKQ